MRRVARLPVSLLSSALVSSVQSRAAVGFYTCPTTVNSKAVLLGRCRAAKGSGVAVEMEEAAVILASSLEVSAS